MPDLPLSVAVFVLELINRGKSDTIVTVVTPSFVDTVVCRLEAADPGQASTGLSKVQAARFYSQSLGEWIWLVFDYPGERLAYQDAREVLRLRNWTPWKIYTRSFTPSDGYACYFGDEIPHLRGKSTEELQECHEVKTGKHSHAPSSALDNRI